MYEAAPAEAKAYFIWGDELPGFGVRIFASGEREHLAAFKRPRSIDFVETIPHSEAGKVLRAEDVDGIATRMSDRGARTVIGPLDYPECE